MNIDSVLSERYLKLGYLDNMIHLSYIEYVYTWTLANVSEILLNMQYCIFITEENTFNLARKKRLGFTYILLCVN